MKIKNKVVGLALALGAAVAPLATKANTETNAAPKTVELTKAEKAQKLKEAVHLGLPREELLKYVDFPEWMPVTKDGKYDKDKATEMYRAAGFESDKNQQAFIDYMAAVEKGSNPDIEFQKFAKQITGGDAKQMAAVNQIKNTLQRTQEQNSSDDMNRGIYLLALNALAVSMGITGVRLGTTIASKSSKSEPIGALVGMVVVSGAVITTMIAGKVKTLSRTYNNTFRQLYNAYANQEIQKVASPEASKIVQMDMQQAKQFIEMAKQKGTEK